MATLPASGGYPSNSPILNIHVLWPSWQEKWRRGGFLFMIIRPDNPLYSDYCLKFWICISPPFRHYLIEPSFKQRRHN